MDTPQMIALDHIVLRDDLDPRLGERDDDLIAQYAAIFDALPPIELNQDNELIDGWHRVRAAERAGRSEISYVVITTDGDDDLGDKMWAANLKHGVQYTRAQRQTQGLKLHERGLKAKEIAGRVGVSASSVYSWTKALREQEKQERDAEIARLQAEGKNMEEIGEELDIDATTVARNLQNSKSGKMQVEPENESEPTREAVEEEPEAALETERDEAAERLVEEQSDERERESEPASVEAEMNEAPVAEEETAALEPDADEAPADETSAAEELEPEPLAPEEIPDHILETARAVMGAFAETRPEAYVARLEASASERMTITDDSLSNELERELLTSAAAMCLWQEWMVWYLGERTSAFTDAFGKIGPVFVRGQAGQWRIVSKLRSMLRRLTRMS